MTEKLHFIYNLKCLHTKLQGDLGVAALNKVREEKEHLPWWLKTPDC